jgi:GAF domain-containing protein/PAS domain-containing protein
VTLAFKKLQVMKVDKELDSLQMILTESLSSRTKAQKMIDKHTPHSSTSMSTDSSEFIDCNQEFAQASDLASLPFPVIFVSSAGTYLTANEAAVTQLNVKLGKQSLNQELLRFLSPEQVQRLQARFVEFCASSSVCRLYDIEGGVLHRSGQFREVSLYFAKTENLSGSIALLFLPGRRLHLQSELTDLRIQYRRLVDYTAAVVIRTDPRLIITGVSGDCEKVLGIDSNNLLFSRLAFNSYLQSLVPKKQRAQLMRQFRRYFAMGVPVQDEILSSLSVDWNPRWFSVVAVPVYGGTEDDITTYTAETDTAMLGWEIILKDITDAKRLSQERDAQERRLSALYEVAKALEFNSEASEVTSRGLEALMRATDASSGFVAFYDRTTKNLCLAASSGLSHEFVTSIEKQIQQASSLARKVVESGKGVIVDNLQNDFRVDCQLAMHYGTRSLLMVPLIYEDNSLGVVAIFSQQERFFSQADFNLASISASQICLAARRAEFYMAEKRQASALAALYRLSHELSKYHSPRDIAQHSFTVIQDELACKRMWLGTLDEAGEHVVGQAGVGPGLRRYLQTLQVELLKGSFRAQTTDNYRSRD